MTRAATARRRIDNATTERQFQAQVMEALKLHGWLAYHTHDSRRSDPGFPDILAVKGARLLALELKREKGYRITPDQRLWLVALERAGVETRLYRPSDWPDLVETIR